MDIAHLEKPSCRMGTDKLGRAVFGIYTQSAIYLWELRTCVCLFDWRCFVCLPVLHRCTDGKQSMHACYLCGMSALRLVHNIAISLSKGIHVCQMYGEHFDLKLASHWTGTLVFQQFPVQGRPKSRGSWSFPEPPQDNSLGQMIENLDTIRFFTRQL